MFQLYFQFLQINQANRTMATNNSTAIKTPTMIPPICPAEIGSLPVLGWVMEPVVGVMEPVVGVFGWVVAVGDVGQSGARMLSRDTGQVGST